MKVKNQFLSKPRLLIENVDEEVKIDEHSLDNEEGSEMEIDDGEYSDFVGS